MDWWNSEHWSSFLCSIYLNCRGHARIGFLDHLCDEPPCFMYSIRSEKKPSRRMRENCMCNSPRYWLRQGSRQPRVRSLHDVKVDFCIDLDEFSYLSNRSESPSPFVWYGPA